MCGLTINNTRIFDKQRIIAIKELHSDYGANLSTKFKRNFHFQARSKVGAALRTNHVFEWLKIKQVPGIWLLLSEPCHLCDLDHGRTLLPAELASVSFGFVLVRVRGRMLEYILGTRQRLLVFKGSTAKENAGDSFVRNFHISGQFWSKDDIY
jgi:hypothetical protein